MFNSTQKKLIFWQNTVSILQAPLLSELSSLGVDVSLVAEEGLLQKRKELGWSYPSILNCNVVESPSRAARRWIIKNSNETTFNIVTGFHAYAETYWTLKELHRSKKSFGVFIEPVRDDGLAGLVKRRYYELHKFRFGADLKFLLATGRNAVSWFGKRGFSKEKSFLFGYFPDVSDDVVPSQNIIRRFGQELHIGFVGQLCRRKGIIDLLHAVRELSHSAWQCHIIGSGDLEDFCKNFELSSDSGGKLHIHGAVPYREVGGFLVEFDLLVLPSHFDGWGAVVNEALQCGIPVLVSDACGSCDLVRHSEVGRIFRAGSVEDLRDKLEVFTQEGKLSLERRARIREWARKTISPKAGASYLLEILEYTSGQREERPVAPWHRERVL